MLQPSSPGYTKQRLAKTLGFNRNMFYYHHKLEQKDKELANQIEAYHRDLDDTLGHKKLAPLLGVGKNRVLRVMRKYDLRARRARGYKYYGKSEQISENIANRPEVIDTAMPIVFSDIFEFKLTDGTKVRGCFALHKQTRQVLSLAFDYWMKADLVVSTIKRMDFTTEAIFHSDQGRQFGARVTLETLLAKGFTTSMSRAGTPTDNGYAERFVGVFKHAVVRRRKYRTLGEFLEAAEDWVNFYNQLRPHESLGQKSPAQYARDNGMQVVPYLTNLFA